jgi:hypothetical protein
VEGEGPEADRPDPHRDADEGPHLRLEQGRREDRPAVDRGGIEVDVPDEPSGPVGVHRGPLAEGVLEVVDPGGGVAGGPE